MQKLDRGFSHLFHSELHWLDIHAQSYDLLWTSKSRSTVPDGLLCAYKKHLMFQAVSICSQPIIIIWSYHEIVAASMATEHSPLHVR